MYEEIVARRSSRWTSIEGETFQTQRYINVIFYVIEDVRNNVPMYCYGAFGACIGGGGMSKEEAVDFVNRYPDRKYGETPLTVMELNEAIEELRQRILKKEEAPVVYFHSYDDDHVFCPFCHHEKDCIELLRYKSIPFLQ